MARDALSLLVKAVGRPSRADLRALPAGLRGRVVLAWALVHIVARLVGPAIVAVHRVRDSGAGAEWLAVDLADLGRLAARPMRWRLEAAGALGRAVERLLAPLARTASRWAAGGRITTVVVGAAGSRRDEVTETPSPARTWPPSRRPFAGGP